MGPLGHIYLPAAPAGKNLESLARTLVNGACIPLVLFTGNNHVWGLNGNGVFDLGKQAHRLLGKDHPFLRQAAEDLERTCRHPHAGDLVISGWDPEDTPLSFNVENGAHGGPGKEETQGFILLPSEVRTGKEYLRPLDLREYVRSLFKPGTE
jgi:hypothetical protein